MKICPMMSYHAGQYGGSKKECDESKCAFWSDKYYKCSITALAEKDIVLPSVMQVEQRERISY